MKRYAITSWVDQSTNPFSEPVYPVLEAPVAEPLPGAQDTDVGIPPGNTGVPTSIDPNAIPQQEPVQQDPMKGAGPVKPNPIPEEIPDNMEPEDEEPMIDFETEKIDYMNLATNQKDDEMMDKLLEMRDIKNLSPGQYKFITDNIEILSLARDVDFFDVRKKVYKQIKGTFGQLAPSSPEDTEIPEPTSPQIPSSQLNPVPGGEFESYQPGWNLTGIHLTEAPFDPAPSGAFTPSGEVPSGDFADAGPEDTQIPQPGPVGGETDDAPEVGATDLEDIDDVGPGSNQMTTISGVELYSILSQEIEQSSTITSTLQKLPSFYSMKSDLFRKIIAALMNGVQIGSGGQLEDIFIPIADDGIGIKICTRIYTDFGNIQIGKWTVQFNDPEKFLSSAELRKLNDTGSPEEKEVLRKRVVVESIAEKFKDRVFIVMVINAENGDRHEIGFNFAELIRDGWKNGYISITFKPNVGKGEAGIEIDGELIDLQAIEVDYIKENPDELDDQGRPVKEPIELMRLENGFLYLTIMGEDFENFANSARAGLFHMMKPFDSGTEELTKIQRCIPDIKEILLKKC